MVVNWADGDLYREMQHKRGELGKEYIELKPKVNRLQRKYFATNRDEIVGQEFGDALKKEFALLRRYKPVIQYWVEWEKRLAN